MIAPLQKDDELLADIMSAEPARDDFSLWWLGQSGDYCPSYMGCAVSI